MCFSRRRLNTAMYTDTTGNGSTADFGSSSSSPKTSSSFQSKSYSEWLLVWSNQGHKSIKSHWMANRLPIRLPNWLIRLPNWLPVRRFDGVGKATLFRRSYTSCPNTIGFQCRRDVHDCPNCSKHLCSDEHRPNVHTILSCIEILWYSGKYCMTIGIEHHITLSFERTSWMHREDSFAVVSSMGNYIALWSWHPTSRC